MHFNKGQVEMVKKKNKTKHPQDKVLKCGTHPNTVSRGEPSVPPRAGRGVCGHRAERRRRRTSHSVVSFRKVQKQTRQGQGELQGNRRGKVVTGRSTRGLQSVLFLHLGVVHGAHSPALGGWFPMICKLFCGHVIPQLKMVRNKNKTQRTPME